MERDGILILSSIIPKLMQKVEGEKRKERGRRHRRTTKLINSNYKENRKPNTNRKLNIQSLISLKKLSHHLHLLSASGGGEAMTIA